MPEYKTYFIGMDGEQTVSSEETQKQINITMALRCDLEVDGEQMEWSQFNDVEEPRTRFQNILNDRKIRMDNNTAMADRPNFCVITVVGNRAVRLEYYEGHDALSLRYDLRNRELTKKSLPNFMDEDPQAYDPVKFLADTFGMPEDLTRPILDEIHKDRR